MREINTSNTDLTDAFSEDRRAPRVSGGLPVAASSDSPRDATVLTGRNGASRPVVTQLAATLVKARELRGRLSDVDTMRRRLESVRSRASIRMAMAERDLVTAREVGRDFCAARVRHEVQGLRDEAVETDALLDELDAVGRTLERERRSLLARLRECSSVAEALPTEQDRSRARQIITDALRRLGVTRTGELQTFTRGDTKQYGHAR